MFAVTGGIGGRRYVISSNSISIDRSDAASDDRVQYRGERTHAMHWFSRKKSMFADFITVFSICARTAGYFQNSNMLAVRGRLRKGTTSERQVMHP